MVQRCFYFLILANVVIHSAQMPFDICLYSNVIMSRKSIIKGDIRRHYLSRTIYLIQSAHSLMLHYKKDTWQKMDGSLLDKVQSAFAFYHGYCQNIRLFLNMPKDKLFTTFCQRHPWHVHYARLANSSRDGFILFYVELVYITSWPFSSQHLLLVFVMLFCWKVENFL